MIILKEGINSAFVTIRERSVVTNASILIELTSSDNKQNLKILKVLDSSQETDRVNELIINVVNSSGNEDLENGSVFLIPGRYKYRIFETSDQRSLDLSEANLLEIGILIFEKDKQKSNYSRQKQKKVYNG